MKYYVALVIRDPQERFLVLNHFKKSAHPWRFPGGKVEPGELPIVAAARELYEELGVEPLSLRLIATPTANVDGEDWCGYFFLADNLVGTPTIKEPQKHSELKYMSGFDLMTNNCTPESEVASDVRFRYYENVPQWIVKCVNEVRSC